jgi:hypothetical protein
MAPAGLALDIVASAMLIDRGRKGFATYGEEHNGHVAWEEGMAAAGAAFAQANATADPQTLILAESAFLQQELQYCDKSDTEAQSSLKAAIQSFEDALRSLKTVENGSQYRDAETTWPTNPKNRVQGCPKDAFHQACVSHRTRLQNSLRAPGINMTEKALLQQRAANMIAARNGYIAKQKKALDSKYNPAGTYQ